MLAPSVPRWGSEPVDDHPPADLDETYYFSYPKIRITNAQRLAVFDSRAIKIGSLTDLRFDYILDVAHHGKKLYILGFSAKSTFIYELAGSTRRLVSFPPDRIAASRLFFRRGIVTVVASDAIKPLHLRHYTELQLTEKRGRLTLKSSQRIGTYEDGYLKYDYELDPVEAEHRRDVKRRLDSYPFQSRQSFIDGAVLVPLLASPSLHYSTSKLFFVYLSISSDPKIWKKSKPAYRRVVLPDLRSEPKMAAFQDTGLYYHSAEFGGDESSLAISVIPDALEAEPGVAWLSLVDIASPVRSLKSGVLSRRLESWLS